MIKIEKVFNILFYNFHKVDYNYRKLLIVYLNPFCWIMNLSKLKLGSKVFFRHMEKNFPTFLDLYRNDVFSKLFFMILLILINSVFINLLLLLFGFELRANYFIILIIASLMAIIQSFVFIFQDDKFYKYHKSFENDNKYNYSFITIIVIFVIFVLWMYSFYM